MERSNSSTGVFLQYLLIIKYIDLNKSYFKGDKEQTEEAEARIENAQCLFLYRSSLEKGTFK